MDKLRQVLQYKFWIVLVVALILPVVGWSMARSGMMQETETRTKTLDELEKKLSAGADDPNSDWQTGLQAINSVQKSQIREAWLALYEHQKQFMTWPRLVPDDPAKFEPHHLERYRVKYAEEIEKVRQTVKPIDD